MPLFASTPSCPRLEDAQRSQKGRRKPLSKKNRGKKAALAKRIKTVEHLLSTIRVKSRGLLSGRDFDDDFLLLFVRKFVFGEKVELNQSLCPRFLIKSSNVPNLISKKISVRDLHGDFFAGRNRFLGKPKLSPEASGGTRFETNCKRSQFQVGVALQVSTLRRDRI